MSADKPELGQQPAAASNTEQDLKLAKQNRVLRYMWSSMAFLLGLGQIIFAVEAAKWGEAVMGLALVLFGASWYLYGLPAFNVKFQTGTVEIAKRFRLNLFASLVMIVGVLLKYVFLI